MPTAALRVAGAVLCGGRSQRMGLDKAFIEIDGRPLARRVHDALVASGASPVIAVGGAADRIAAIGLVPVADQHPGEGPLGAIVSALGALGDADVVVVLACDLADADPRAVAAVLAPLRGPNGDAIDVVVPRSRERRHMHHAAWHRRCLPTLADAFAAGERAPRRVLAQLRVHELPVHELTAAGGFDPAWLSDLDSPDDLRRRQQSALQSGDSSR